MFATSANAIAIFHATKLVLEGTVSAGTQELHSPHYFLVSCQRLQISNSKAGSDSKEIKVLLKKCAFKKKLLVVQHVLLTGRAELAYDFL